MSTVISKNVQIGADATPSNNFTWYQPSTPDGTVRLGSGNSGSVTDVLSVSSTGLGIGTSSPSYKLDVAGIGRLTTAVNSNATSLILNNSNTAAGGVGVSIDGYSGNTSNKLAQIVFGGAGATGGNIDFLTSANGSSYVDRMRLDSSGNLGIGTSSPTQKLTVAGNLAFTTSENSITWVSGNGIVEAPSTLYLRSTGAGNVILQTNGSERLRIDSSGNLGLGVTPSAWSSGGQLQLADNKAICSSGQYINLGSNWYYLGGFKYISTAAASNYEQNAGAHRWFTAPSGTAGNAISFTQAMTLDASGNLLLGTTSGTGKLVVSDATDPVIRLQNTKNGSWTAGDPFGELYFYSSDTSGAGAGDRAFIKSVTADAFGASSAMSFGIAESGGNATEKMRIDQSGNLLVGTTSGTANAKIDFVASAAGQTFRFQATSGSYAGTMNYLVADRSASTAFDFYGAYAAGAAQFSVKGNGVIYAQNTSVQSISDQRLKENIRDATDGLKVINALRTVRFDWKAGYGNDRKNQLGFIAQEVEAVFPEAVSEWQVNKEDETIYKTVGPSAFIPVLVKAIQEQQAIIEQLKARLDAANL